MSKDEVFTQLERFRDNDMQTHGGKVWAYVYDSGLREVEEVAATAYTKYMNENALDFTVFPSLLQMENDIVAIVAEMFAPQSGDAESVLPIRPSGTFTSGGTESILLAVKAARDWARATKPDITLPEVILPVTAHAAFHKAAHYFGLKPVVVPVNAETFRVDADVVCEHLTDNTVMLVGSAVNYSHGVTDPVHELGAIALEYKLWLHVDACIGGFLMHYLRDVGELIPDFDFRVPGVSSLSVDLHKYAYAAKGASVVLYRDAQLRQYEMFASTRWAGYPMINTTIQSTKSGGPLAACWAVMHYLGEDGYRTLAKKTLHTRERLQSGLAKLPELRVLGMPEAGLIAFTSDTVDVFALADEMKRRDWFVQVQPGRPATDNLPGLVPTLHLTVTGASEKIVEPFLADLEGAIESLKRDPVDGGGRGGRPSQPSTTPTVVEQLATVNPETLTPEVLTQLLRGLGLAPGQLPGDMADINRLLRVLPPDLMERLFIAITSEMYTPRPWSSEAAGGHTS
ncbi:pyridoxal phosphate-dependent decarboxylase family protein [Alicyclobacillus sp. ALC3]|uniref:pyridoxal phosphate-dependent decarboxylase family protein n=1 Tax=Alicyclobacillus sp. ALC3 TaxID=2796143 RepID=UPI002379E90C|nr:aspartate aminotransferase family protein [Alicyclobacillus sp. ALC3]WDL95945.1 aspartate aminotransferase family protein [Alicyclobacillus sp. ALC3]